MPAIPVRLAAALMDASHLRIVTIAKQRGDLYLATVNTA
jgi:hypothetical protein